ncbi:hypothetical protein PROFUN_09898 [Planoprotostelium fungivorum]|uniref:Uncharacterized protein n=1 Tax=Planoprotostelium fungivorum TaxID=1890364 RepID=A0A2P6NGG1_9EUKA|nr:hypothetical protein PROFUN_09898 [Planoprotostelium fungivorum]
MMERIDVIRTHLLVNREEDISDAWPLSKKELPWLKRKVCGVMPRWALILIISLFLFIVGFLLTWFLLLPIIVQSVVNGSSLSFTEIHMRSPTHNSFRIDAKGSLKKAGPISATITAPSKDPNAEPVIQDKPPSGSVTIHYEDVPMAYMFLPDTHTQGGKEDNDLIIEDRIVAVINTTKWSQFGRDLIEKDTLVWHLKGLVDLTAFGRTYKDVQFSKDVNVPGFKGLKNVTVEHFDLESSNHTSINAKMTVAISSDSMVNIGDMGDLEMEMYYEGVMIGTLSAKNTSLHTGTTLMDTTGTITSSNTPLLSRLMSRYLGVYDSPVMAKIIGTSNDLLRDALVGVELSTVLPANPTNLIEKLNFDGINITPLGEAKLFLLILIVVDDLHVGMESASVVSVQSIMGPRGYMDITYVTLDVDVMHDDVILGHLRVDAPVSNGSRPTFDVLIGGNITMTEGGKKWAQFTTQYVSQATTRLTLRGKMGATVQVPIGAMTLDGLSIDSHVDLVGMQGLKNTTVLQLDMPNDTRDGGIRMIISVVMENPSVATMAMGDIHFTAYYEDAVIGELMAKNVTMVPGSNPITMEGELKPTDPTNANPKIQEFFNRYIHGESTVVTVRGYVPKSNTTKRSEDSNNLPDWVKTVIESLNVSTAVEGPKNLSLIGGLDLHSLGMRLPGLYNETEDDGMIPITSSVTAGFFSPFGFNISVHYVRIFPEFSQFFLKHFFLYENSWKYQVSVKIDMLLDGLVIATMDDYTEWLPATSDQLAQRLDFTLSGAQLRVVDRQRFGNVTAGLLLNSGMNFTMAGVSKANITTNIGNFTLKGVNFTSPVHLEGFNGFPNGSIEMIGTNQNITSGHSWGLYMLTEIVMHNPTIVSLQVSSMVMDIYFEGVYMGNVTIDSPSLVPGPNTLIGNVMYVSPNKTLYGHNERTFFSRYTQGNSSLIELRGNSNNIPLLTDGLSRLVTSTVFIGQLTPLMKYVQMTVSFVHLSIMANVEVTNPFKTGYTISDMKSFTVHASNDWRQLGTLQDVHYAQGFPVDAGHERTLNPMTFDIGINVLPNPVAWVDAARALLLQNASTAVGELNFSLGDFGPVTIDYQQSFTVHFRSEN